MAFASPQDAGWDPTIRRLSSDKAEDNYDITVHSNTDNGIVERTYRTIGLLSGSDSLRGRGTRAFKARLLGPDGEPFGEPVALKDCWADVDQPREVNIQQEIYNEAQQSDRDLMKTHFLTVLAHGNVMIDNAADHTRNMMRGFPVPRVPAAKLGRYTTKVSLDGEDDEDEDDKGVLPGVASTESASPA